jgi:septum formation protein
VVASRYPEGPIPGAAPAELVLAHAEGKAREVAGRAGLPAGGAVLGADTAVVLGRRILGKPGDREEARAMLSALAGRRHVVMTAVCLVDEGGEHGFVDEAVVEFRRFPDTLVEWYLDRGEWQGRAGAYAIQGSGAALVERVEGDFSTVVGLPLGRLVGLLESLGRAPWQG